MFVNTYSNATEFLTAVRVILEQHEAANNLMLGIANRLTQNPTLYGSVPVLLSVQDHHAFPLIALQTPPNNLMVYATPHTDETTRQVAMGTLADYLVGLAHHLPGVVGAEPTSREFAAVWAEEMSLYVEQHMAMRVYELREVLPTPMPQGSARRAAVEDMPQLIQWYLAFDREATGEGMDYAAAEKSARIRMEEGGMYLWLAENGAPVSMAAIGRYTTHGAVVGPVYTPPDQRGHGYATALTAHVSQQILGMGKHFAALFTDLANPTSNSIYQKIGYRPVCDYGNYKFIS